MDLKASHLGIAAIALLAGCSSGAISPAPSQLAVAAVRPVHGRAAPASATSGIYVGLGNPHNEDGVFGYPPRDRRNKPWTCSEASGGTADVAVDGKGNLMVTDAGGETLFVYQGPAMCGPLLGSISTNGLSFDAASADAAKGKIVVANIYTNSPSARGDIAVCTLAAGCTTSLQNSSVFSFFSVALAKNGDCWGSGSSGSGALLVYFRKCSGSGQLADGFKNSNMGGLDVDKDGNLVTIDQSRGFWVYKGCKPKCTLAGGPFPLQGGTEYGHLNGDSTRLAAADWQYGQVDIYAYRPDEVRYEYSFNSGINTADAPVAAAFNPRSKE